MFVLVARSTPLAYIEELLFKIAPDACAKATLRGVSSYVMPWDIVLIRDSALRCSESQHGKLLKAKKLANFFKVIFSSTQ